MLLVIVIDEEFMQRFMKKNCKRKIKESLELKR